MRLRRLEGYRIGGAGSRMELGIPLPQTPDGRVYRFSPNENAHPRHFVLGKRIPGFHLPEEMTPRMTHKPGISETVCPYSGVVAEDDAFTHPDDKAAALAWISTDWNPSNAGFGKGFRQLRISALSVIRYGELITRVHAVSFASATILGESGTPRFRCIDLRRMPASWRSQVSWFNSRLTPDMANDTAHMCLSDHYMN